MPANVTGVSTKPNEDGYHLLELRMPDGSTNTASISPDMARTIVVMLQPYVLEDALRVARTLTLPQVHVNGLSLVHQGPQAQLLVSTDEIGSLVLTMSNHWAMEAQRMVDHVILSRKNLVQ